MTNCKGVMLAVVSKIKRIFKRKYVPSFEDKERSRMFEALKYWTPELIEWIGKTEDPIKLANASCLVNCHEWPDWLPSKPEWHNDMNSQSEDYNAKLYFVCEVYRICKNKSQAISPGLYDKIWLTHSFKNPLDALTDK